ncbi:MAG: hypothetical protein Kow0063_23780 [Anaerolineae bacterium]
MSASDVYSDTYWTDEFSITEADLERIAAYIQETGQAHDLTTLTRRILRGRLRYGPETSAPAQSARANDASVQLWDPAGKWKEGDQAIVVRLVGKNMYEAFVGEVIAVEPDQVKLQLDGIDQPATYLRAAPGSEKARKWHAKVREVVAQKRKASGFKHQIEVILMTHGERIASQLLNAMRADGRFVRLAGRWFLRGLALPPTQEQLAALAWAMVRLEEPQPTDALVPLVQPPLAEGDPGLFGLYLAMRDRPDLFANADPGQRPRWELAGPPPGAFTPRHAAYDPDTYEILCHPDQPAPPEIVRRLWDLELLKAVA